MWSIKQLDAVESVGCLQRKLPWPRHTETTRNTARALMSNSDTPYVLIVGAGAIGTLYGAALAKQNTRVAVVCRSDFDIVQRDGYDIRSQLLGNHCFRPHQVFRTVGECTVSPDYVVLTSKVLPGVDRVSLIRPAIGPLTTIVLIQNGIDIEAEIAQAFPANELLTSLAFVMVARAEPGVVLHHSMGTLTMGRYPSGITPSAQRLAGLFEASGVGCKLTENVISARWQKAVWNTAFNPVSIMGGVLDTWQMLHTEADQAFMAQVMQEVCDVASAAGHPQSPRLVENMIAGTRRVPAYKTSMALDYENRRPLESEAILGNVVRAGRRLGVSMPSLESIYALTKMIEAAHCK